MFARTDRVKVVHTHQSKQRGYCAGDALAKHFAAGTDFETFFAKAPKLNPNRSLVRGVICGVRIEEIDDPLMREVRILDKLIDELAKGKAMEKILRAGWTVTRCRRRSTRSGTGRWGRRRTVRTR